MGLASNSKRAKTFQWKEEMIELHYSQIFYTYTWNKANTF